MGKIFYDKYSLLHFAVGICAYFWNISLVNFVILHVIFEIIENTQTGVYVIDKYIPFWPGGKLVSDTITNSIGDTFFAVLGWIIAFKISHL